ncbi:MAG: hypothetical protein ACPGLY_21970 [Rubripirellula sp.]
MFRSFLCPFVFLLISVEFASAQSSAAAAARRRQQQMQQKAKEMAENQPQLPSDPQLLTLHKEFIAKAERLAVEYERKKQLDKAREVYEAMVRLVPKYGAAEDGLSRVLGSQRYSDRKLVNVEANKLWQDTGVVLQQGMPVHTEIKGTWKVVYETGPKGIEIPNEMRPRDNRIKLGTLIGVIASSQAELTEANPFILENGKDFTARKTGRLFLRMFDVDPSDNEGKLYVLIQSTFAK